MKLRESLQLPLSASAAAAMYADPAYPPIRQQILEATSADATVQGDPTGAFTVTTELAMPTDRVPDMARPFIGSSLTVREIQTWSAPGGDGARTGSMELTVVGTPAGVTAQLRMSPQGESACTVEIDGDLTAKVPLVGSRLEKAALPYASKVLRAEERAAGRYREQRAG
jgi:hypothetical protein